MLTYVAQNTVLWWPRPNPSLSTQTSVELHIYERITHIKYILASSSDVKNSDQLTAGRFQVTKIYFYFLMKYSNYTLVSISFYKQNAYALVSKHI